MEHGDTEISASHVPRNNAKDCDSESSDDDSLYDGEGSIIESSSEEESESEIDPEELRELAPSDPAGLENISSNGLILYWHIIILFYSHSLAIKDKISL